MVARGVSPWVGRAKKATEPRRGGTAAGAAPPGLKSFWSPSSPGLAPGLLSSAPTGLRGHGAKTPAFNTQTSRSALGLVRRYDHQDFLQPRPRRRVLHRHHDAVRHVVVVLQGEDILPRRF